MAKSQGSTKGSGSTALPSAPVQNVQPARPLGPAQSK